MASQVPTSVPQGRVVNIGIPDSEDIPRLVFTAPYFTQVPLAELIEPSVIEAVNNVLPSLVPPYVDAAAQAAVQAQAVLLVGSTMTGPLFLNPVMPTADAQAASKAYIDTMLSTAGIPEVPPVPSGQVWARETGQWVPISQTGGTFLPIAGGSMQGNINMSGNTITNMAAVPAMPNGAAPAQWVLNQIASVSLYQGTWDADTNVPDLTQLSTHVNAYTWIAITTAPAGVVIGPAIPGLQGTTVFNGDTIIFSTVQGGFKAIHSGGITLPEADGRYVQLAGSQMSGALLLNANATQPMQATTFQQLEAAVANSVTPDAPADGQAYLRVGVGASRWVPGLPLAGGILTGALTLSGNAAQPLNAVPLQQVNSLITAGTTGFLPLAGGQMTGLMQLSGNATVNLNPVPLQQVNSMLGTYAPLQNPSFIGTPGPTGPTQNPGTNNTTLATTAFVTAAIRVPATATPLMDGAAAVGTSLLYARQDHVHPSDTSRLALTGGTLSGTLTLPAGSAGAPSLAMNGAGLWSNASGDITAQANNFRTAGVIWASGSVHSTANFVVANGASLVQTSGTGGWTLSSAAGNILTSLSDAQWQWAVNSAGVMELSFGGDLTIAGTLAQGSDERSKGNIAAFVPGVSIVGQLLPKVFTYNSDTASPQFQHLGFMAQDVQPVLPQAVSGSEQTSFGLDTTPIIAACVNAVKQLIARVAALEANANITPPAAETA